MHTILAPVMALVVWSLFMLFWLTAARFPEIGKAKIDIFKRPGVRGQNLEGVLPDRVNWPSHNYTHLMEQPVRLVLFFLATLCLWGLAIEAVRGVLAL